MVKLDIISDPICPWCYIGKANLDKALLQFPDHPFVMEWHPFQLNPDMPVGGMDRREYLETKFGGKEAAIKAYAPVATSASSPRPSPRPPRRTASSATTATTPRPPTASAARAHVPRGQCRACAQRCADVRGVGAASPRCTSRCTSRSRSQNSSSPPPSTEPYWLPHGAFSASSHSISKGPSWSSPRASRFLTFCFCPPSLFM